MTTLATHLLAFIAGGAFAAFVITQADKFRSRSPYDPHNEPYGG